MKKLKSTVFQSMKNKRIVSGFSIRSLGTILLLPFLVTILWGNSNQMKWSENENVYRDEKLTGGYVNVVNQTNSGVETIPLELYVADKLSRSINTEYEKEALTAQAVLIRTNLLANRVGRQEILITDEAYGGQLIPDQIWQAVRQSIGICLTKDDVIIKAPYFAISNGATRNGQELLSEDYAYLQSILCTRDFLAEDYTGSIFVENDLLSKIWQTLPETTLPEKLESRAVNQAEETAEKSIQNSVQEDFVFVRDSVGYVLYVKKQEKTVTGESFQKALGLPSACFHFEKSEKSTLITVKGVGHGLGMSQYGANQMAKQGKDYIEILETFFPQITITKFE